MPHHIGQIPLLLEKAEQHIDADEDNAALRLLTDVFTRLKFPETDEEAALFEQTFALLFRLSRTDNEYVSEQCSKLFPDYFEWIEESEREHKD